MDDEERYIEECWAFLEKPKPGRRVADGARSAYDLLDQMFKSSPNYQSFREQEVVARWEEVVGPQVAAYVKATDVQHSELWLKCQSAVWKTELNFRRGQILARIAELYGKGLIRNLRIF